ncbi:MAG: NERD domain-containing protein, partial [Chloroflexota bacterium]
MNNDPKRSAERRMYKTLGELDDKYTIYYSVAWQSRNRHTGVYDGEADFVIAHPDFGVLILEVKGGRITYDARLDQWYSTDRDNERHAIKDPVQQALRSAKTLLRKFQDLPRWGHRWLTIGHAVAFPDVYVGATSLKLDLPPEIIISAEEMEHIAETTHNIFDYYADKENHRGSLGRDRLELVDGLLAQSFELHTPLGVELAQEDARLVELTEQQMGILDFLSYHRRAAIQGCAGSGKTMLALRKAEHLASQGFNVLLTCFNHALASDLNQKVDGSFSIMHFHGLCRHFVREVGFTIQSPSTTQNFYDNQMPDALLDA